MKVVIPGGSGQVGTVLARAFQAERHEVVVLSRRAGKEPWRTVAWDGQSAGPWCAELEGADVVINLAGWSVNCRYTAVNRRLILDSRVNSTRAGGRAIAKASRPPRVWLQMSSATIYSHRFDRPNDEFSGIIGGGEPDAPRQWRHSIDVVKAWEAACNEAHTPATRKVLLRTSMVMSPDRGGVFDALLGLVRRGLGGRAGDGRQMVSWIHERDFVRAMMFLIEHSEIAGAVNIAAPGALPNAQFMADLRAAWGARFGLPAARWMLDVGAFLMNTETELILKSRYVAPGVLSKAGFNFEFPVWAEAARDLCGRCRAAGMESRTVESRK